MNSYGKCGVACKIKQFENHFKKNKTKAKKLKIASFSRFLLVKLACPNNDIVSLSRTYTFKTMYFTTSESTCGFEYFPFWVKVFQNNLYGPTKMQITKECISILSLFVEKKSLKVINAAIKTKEMSKLEYKGPNWVKGLGIARSFLNINA